MKVLPCLVMLMTVICITTADPRRRSRNSAPSDTAKDTDSIRDLKNQMKALQKELSSLKSALNDNKVKNREDMKTVKASIVDTRNFTRNLVQLANDNLREYKKYMTEVNTEMKASINEKKAYTNIVKQELMALIRSNKNDTNTKILEFKTTFRDYKAHMVGVVAGLRGDIGEAGVEMGRQMEDVLQNNDKYRATISSLARQTMLLQFGVEERVRTDGDSGIKMTRGAAKGPDNYYETGLFGPNFNMIHDHSDYDRTIGMGEVVTVLNGVEFKTRHNDYKLKMASTTSTEYQATEDIPFPDVPPSVTGTVDEQILEMREYFKAFADQNTTHRDYKAYFRPVLCYMEGSWTKDTDGEIDEPFASDRHQIDASSWFDLQEKVRFASYTGTKSRLENFANLPTTIMSVNDTTGLPDYAQWNYRILCKPIDEDMPTKDFRQMDDLAFRIPKRRSMDDVHNSRGGRYRLYEEKTDKFTQYSKIDRLFYTVPGMDNLPGNLSQISFGDKMMSMGSVEDEPLNTGFYHRFFKFGRAGAMGVRDVARGFNDASLWVAQTSQERIAPVKMKECNKNGRQCQYTETRFTYAIPLEIIYLTPLLTWNPYDLETGKTEEQIRAGGRNGRLETDLAFNGTGPHKGFYMTPSDFFQGKVDQSDPADTVRNAVGVLDKQGVMRKVTPSGTKIHLQEIEGIPGKIRLRYPISPIHGEGSPVWKELNALKKVVKDANGGGASQVMVMFTMTSTSQNPPGEHNHEFSMTLEDFQAMHSVNAKIDVETSLAHGHTHKLNINYLEHKGIYVYTSCDGQPGCLDGHARHVYLVTDVEALVKDGHDMMMPSTMAPITTSE